MVKTSVKLPAGFECKDGTCLEKPLEFDLEVPEVKPTIQVKPEPQINYNLPPQPKPMQYTQPETHNHDHKKDIHEELSELLPRGQNFGKCANGNCATMVKNPNPVTKFKSCPGCKNNAVPKNNDFCPTCGITENSKGFDEWEDSELELKTEEDEE